MNMIYEALNPRGETDPVNTIGLRPRVKDLNKITLGLLATFKGHWRPIVEEVGRQLQARYPNMKLTGYFEYTKDPNAYTEVAEIAKDPDFKPGFEKWVGGVDAAISGYGDAASCTLYQTYNTAFVERLGKPAVVFHKRNFSNIFRRAAALRGVPAMRHVEGDIRDISSLNADEFNKYLKEEVPQLVSVVLDDIIAALTSPPLPDEANPKGPDENLPRIAAKGDFHEINKYFYQRGWAYGMPIVPPTEDVVKEMIKGTDLPPDHVVAKLPLMNGKATVEKIAINGVMAGCLPIHMPVLIAATQALADTRLWLEAYTCSVASWAPLLIINGPIRRDLDVACGVGVFSPYNRANAAIGNTIGLLIMNIAGVRGGYEDNGLFGHEGRFGICIGENEEESPWEPMHQFYGFNKEDSAVTLFFPNTRQLCLYGADPEPLLKAICDDPQVFGFDPGCAFVLCPEAAKLLHRYGFSREDLTRYIVEYARRPVSDTPVRWIKANNHALPEVVLPAEPTRSVKKFFSRKHIPILVAGMSYGNSITYYGGGGDHGGPVTHKVNLPKKWGELVEKYKDFKTQY
ncbi:MAG TPA: hypothetical protein VMT62_18235 [Syntrophorhabdaceae bacterium]|nr:hypothetical protein [Syntrophorhabdaceae bacterium]